MFDYHKPFASLIPLENASNPLYSSIINKQAPTKWVPVYFGVPEGILLIGYRTVHRTVLPKFFASLIPLENASNPLHSSTINKQAPTKWVPVYFGVPEGIRTSDLPLRRRSLYPTELRKQFKFSK